MLILIAQRSNLVLVHLVDNIVFAPFDCPMVRSRPNTPTWQHRLRTLSRYLSKDHTGDDRKDKWRQQQQQQYLDTH
jgi:hypothetical protein